MTSPAILYPELRRAPVLASLRDAHFDGLMRAMKEHRMAPGEVLFRQGQPGDTMAVIAKGAFRVSVTTADGSQREIGTMGPGDCAGEMVCVDPAPRSATVTAILPSVVFLLRRNMLQVLKEKGPPVVMAMLTGVVGQVTERIRKIHAQVDKRIAALAGPQRAPARSTGRVFPEADALRPQPFQGPIDLSTVTGLDEFSAADQEILKVVSRQLRFPAGAVLCREGDPGSSCFIVVKGEVDLFKQIAGETRRLTTLSGCLLGQMALVDPSPRSATLRTRTEVVVLELVRDAFQQLLGEHSPCALRFQEMLAVTGIRQLREATDRLAGLKDVPTPRAAPAPRAAPTPAPLPRKRPEIGPLAPRPARPTEHMVKPPRGRREEAAPKKKAPHPLPSKHQPRNDKEAMQMTLSYMQASLKEWGMDMDDLDNIQVVKPDGIMSAAERKTRMGR